MIVYEYGQKGSSEESPEKIKALAALAMSRKRIVALPLSGGLLVDNRQVLLERLDRLAELIEEA